MSIESDFADLMVQEVTWERLAGRNQYGEASFGNPITLRARVVGRVQMIRDDDLRERVSRRQAYIFGSPGISIEDRVTLPDGSSPPLLSVQRLPDENGDHHEVIYFG